MDDADINEVYTRLAARETPLLDEGHRPLPVPEQPEPLFLTRKEVGR